MIDIHQIIVNVISLIFLLHNFHSSEVKWASNPHAYLKPLMRVTFLICLVDRDYILVVLIILLVMSNRTLVTMVDKKPRDEPLFDPTSHYFLKNSDYGPITIDNFLIGSTNYYPWIERWQVP